jgi:hypothetical protein
MTAACSTVKVLNTEQGKDVDLTKYKTFGFYQLKATGDTVSKGFEQRIAILKNAISAELNKRGYALSNAGPDMLVNIGIVVKEEVQTRQTDFRTDAPRYIGQRNYSWKSETVEVGRYREGTVTVHLVDATQNKMIWKGAIEGIIPDKNAALEKVSEDGMKKLFEKFPVPVK